MPGVGLARASSEAYNGAMRTVVALSVAGLIFAGVAIREEDWRHTHSYELGPSGYIVALAIAGAIVAFALAVWIYDRIEASERTERSLRERIAALEKRFQDDSAAPAEDLFGAS